MRPIVNAGDIGHDLYHRYAGATFEPCTPRALWAGTGQWNGVTRCFQSKGGSPTVAILGDSHAENLFLGFAEELHDANVAIYSRGSLPFVTNAEYDPLFAYVLAERAIHTVVLAAYWAMRLGPIPAAARAEAMHATVRALLAAGKRVVLVADTPRFAFDPAFCKFAAGKLRPHRCSQSSELQQREAATYRGLFDEIKAAYPQIELVAVSDYFCTETTCAMDREGLLLFRDDNHLGFHGSRYLARRIVADHPRIQAAP
jgi:SGNH domain (fused to AT3 domains)